jgi:glutamate dehydrogenase (NAD(P)+)
MGKWSMIVESANTYSPDPQRKAARMRMERTVYWQAGVLIATDYLVNSGGVIYAAQEKAIQTPERLLIPKRTRGNRRAVDQWLHEHKSEFEILAEKRKIAGEKKVKEVIGRNMKELTDFLVKNPDMLPCDAAEKISIHAISLSLM